MVVIHVKKTEQDQFLYQTTVTASVDTVIRELVCPRGLVLLPVVFVRLPAIKRCLQCDIWNTRLRIGRIADACDDLAKHGPLKPADKRGIDEVMAQSGAVIEKGPRYNADPLGHRTGNPPDPSAAATLHKTAEEARQAVHKVCCQVRLRHQFRVSLACHVRMCAEPSCEEGCLVCRLAARAGQFASWCRHNCLPRWLAGVRKLAIHD